LDLNAHFRVDEYGFFLYWACEGRDTIVIDLVQVWEARPAGLPKDGRVLFELEQRGPRETLEERTIWMTHGIWRNGLNDLLKNTKLRHISYSTCLLKNWRYLCLSLNDRRKIPIKNIVKMFASGKSDKMVQKCLSDLGLSGDKVCVLLLHMDEA
uniref:PH_14 domain-containing protein n=1 Tax=Anisakis simplex TaxID=6269 RepID=A0A0M3KDE9_ANISI